MGVRVLGFEFRVPRFRFRVQGFKLNGVGTQLVVSRDLTSGAHCSHCWYSGTKGSLCNTHYGDGGDASISAEIEAG